MGPSLLADRAESVVVISSMVKVPSPSLRLNLKCEWSQPYNLWAFDNWRHSSQGPGMVVSTVSLSVSLRHVSLVDTCQTNVSHLSAIYSPLEVIDHLQTLVDRLGCKNLYNTCMNCS